MPLYRLHYFPESGNSYKLALMLTLCGQSFEPIWTDFGGGVTRTPEWRRDVNAMGEIPVLEVDGERLIPTGLTGDRCPLPCSHGNHPFDIVDESVPGGAAGLYDLLVSVPNGVSEIVAPQVFPDVLDRVELGCIGWQTEQGNVAWNRQALTGLMPSGAVADQNAVGVRVDGLADLGQVHAHDFATDPRHYHSGADGSFRANRSEQPCRIVPIVAHHRR